MSKGSIVKRGDRVVASLLTMTAVHIAEPVLHERAPWEKIG